MVTAKGQAKVMDFGLAKLRGGSSLTKSQTTLGTVAYMSPEQARGDELDQRTDIWSLGVVLYELLAGKLPFRGDHDQTVIYSILQQEPESLTKLRPGLAPELEHIVFQALTKKAADRYRTMEEFREDLAAIAEGLKPLKAKARPSEPEKSIAVLPVHQRQPRPGEHLLHQRGDGGDPGQPPEDQGAPGHLPHLGRTIPGQEEVRPRDRRGAGRELHRGGQRAEIRQRLPPAGPADQGRAGNPLWGDSFQQKITDVEDIFDIQIRIAKSIAEELRAVISPEEKKLIEKIPVADLAVYDEYLKARSYIIDGRREVMTKALEFLTGAVAKNPGLGASLCRSGGSLAVDATKRVRTAVRRRSPDHREPEQGAGLGPGSC